MKKYRIITDRLKYYDKGELIVIYNSGLIGPDDCYGPDDVKKTGPFDLLEKRIVENTPEWFEEVKEEKSYVEKKYNLCPIQKAAFLTLIDILGLYFSGLTAIEVREKLAELKVKVEGK